MICSYKYSVDIKQTMWDSFQQWLSDLPTLSYPFTVKHLYLSFSNIDYYSSYQYFFFPSPENSKPFIDMYMILELPPDRWPVFFKGISEPIDVPYPWRYLTIRFKNIFSKTITTAAVVSDKMSVTPTDELFHTYLGTVVPNISNGWVCPGKGSYPEKAYSFEDFLLNTLNAHFFGLYNAELYGCIVSEESLRFRQALDMEPRLHVTFKDVRTSFQHLSKFDHSFWERHESELFVKDAPTFPGWKHPNLFFNDHCAYPFLDEDRRQLFLAPIDPKSDLYTIDRSAHSFYTSVTEVSPHFMLMNNGYGYWL